MDQEGFIGLHQRNDKKDKGLTSFWDYVFFIRKKEPHVINLTD